MAVRVQHRVALTPRDGTVIPALAGKRRPVQLLGVVVVAVGRARVVVVGGLGRVVRPPVQRVGPAAVVAAVRLGQILGQLLEIVARHQADLTVVVPGLVPAKGGIVG